MATNQLRRVIQDLCRTTRPRPGESLTDGQLLEQYVRCREEAAFAALVHRHGPMVWGVCRRLLHDHHDIEDAFQATFLVLVRKAASVVPRDRVANWLYGVAHQTALKARATAARRRAREKQVTAMPEPPPQKQETGDDLHALLDQELSRLPDKYRAVIVSCDLEGRTRPEAARHLRVPEGTVASRLATARAMLARRLAQARRAFSGASLAAALAQNVATAGVPASVTSSTIQAASLFAAGQAAAPGILSAQAVALAEGVLWSWLLSKLKIVTALLVAVAVLGAGAAAATRQSSGQPTGQPLAEKQEPANPAAAEKKPGENGTPEVSGVIKGVDAAKQTLTVSQREGDRTFTVSPDAAVVINGRPATLDKLAKGAFAGVSLAEDQKSVRAIEAMGPQVSGLVTAVDVEKRTLGVLLTHGGGEKTITLTRNANVVLDGKPGKLAGLPPGANVTLSWFVDLQTVRNVEAEGPWWQNVVVQAIDPQKNTVTFDDSAREVELAGKTFPLAKGAGVTIDGKQGSKLAGLPAGTFATVHLSVDRKSITNLEVAGREFPVVLVKAVDAAQNTITFADDNQPPDLAGKTFPVARDVNLLIDGRPGILAGVPPGAFVGLTLSADQRTVRRLFAEGARFQDVPVKAVDAQKRTVTFAQEKAPAELAGKTFPVSPDANFEIDGRRGMLAAVPAGAIVVVNLSVDQKSIRFLSAAGSHLGGQNGAVVQAVDAGKNTITVDIAEEGEKTFTLTKEVVIEVDGKPGKLAQIPKDAIAFLTLNADQKTVRMVQAKGLFANGILVKAVDAAKNSITLADDATPAALAGKTCLVARDAKINIDGRPGKLANLPPGASVWLWLSVDQKTAIGIDAEGALLGGSGGVVVQAVDPGKNTITIDVNGEGEKTFTVARDAFIRIDGKPGKLAQVPREAGISLKLCADQMTVKSIEAKSP